MSAFGPIPSRRLGRSLGINNIPPKVCSYSCIYCQLGRTLKLVIKREVFYSPENILEDAIRRVDEATLRGERIDYITFVPDGEPTLDANIGKEILLLKQTGIPVAVLTNASLLWRDDVVEDLLEADLISLKVDAYNGHLWRRINRPHKDLRLDMVFDGMRGFAERFNGRIISETMLIEGIEYGEELGRIAQFLKGLRKLDKAYISIPTRPPTEGWVKPAKREAVNLAYRIFSKRLGTYRVELLTRYEGDAFSSAGNVKEDLLGILAVHPMRIGAVKKLLEDSGEDWQVVEELLRQGEIVKVEYEGNEYYIRKISKVDGPGRT